MLASAIFDCMVFLQGSAKANGPAAACLELVEAGHVQLFLSREIIAEIHDVLTRPKLQRKFPALTSERVNDLMRRFREKAVVLDEPPKAVSLKRDSKDEKYLNLAAIASASYLVSRDKDLLDLRDESNPAHEQFVKTCPKTEIVDPVEFLQIMSSLKQNPPPTSP